MHNSRSGGLYRNYGKGNEWRDMIDFESSWNQFLGVNSVARIRRHPVRAQPSIIHKAQGSSLTANAPSGVIALVF